MYEFKKVDTDVYELSYKDKKFTIRSTVGIMSEMQGLIKEARVNMIKELTKDGISVKDLTIEKKENGKTYYDNSNKEAIEESFMQDVTLKFYDRKCKEFCNMTMQELMNDIGIENDEGAGARFGEDFLNVLMGRFPVRKAIRKENNAEQL